MKKFLIAVIALTASLSAYAQSNYSIGVGAAMRWISEDYLGYDVECHPHTGFTVDASYGYDFNSSVGLSTGLRFSYLFRSERLSVFDVKKIDTDRESYLDLPVHLKFTFNPASSCKFFATVGPTAELWTSYSSSHVIKYMTENQAKDTYTTHHFKDAVPEDLFNRFNVSVGATVGVEVASAVRVSLGYDCYFLDMLKHQWGIQTSRMGRHQLRLGVAYVF